MAIDKITLQNAEAIRTMLLALEMMQKQIDELTKAVEQINSQLTQRN